MRDNTIEKPNVTYEAVIVRPEGNSVGMNFSVEVAYDNYLRTGSYEKVLDSLVLDLMKGLENAPAVTAASISDYDVMKQKLAVEVISAKKNASLLSKIPHERMEDLTVIYRFVLESTSEGRTSLVVTNDLLEKLGITSEQLKDDAMKVAPASRKAFIRDMTDVLKDFGVPGEIFDIFEGEEIMYMASTSDFIGGAGVIAYPDFMEQAAEKLGGSFWVLPSSIDEVLLIGDNGYQSAKDFCGLVQEVNFTEVRPEDRLSDQVYHYDCEARVFELGEKYEARVAEKALSSEVHSKLQKSVVKDLEAKQQKATEKSPIKELTEKNVKSKESPVL